jgi:glyceraldehyde 3-phosphate dehydrogenase
VYGVNHKEFDPEEIDIWSAASCTTNAITPVLKAIEDTLGITKGHLETIHAYTNDQNLVDNMHKSTAVAVLLLLTWLLPKPEQEVQ